jgi:hypothetical protein
MGSPNHLALTLGTRVGVHGVTARIGKTDPPLI